MDVLQWEFMPASLAALVPPIGRGVVLIDETGAVWSPNSVGGHTKVGGGGTITYNSTEIERLSGVPSLTGLPLLLTGVNYPRSFALKQMNNVEVQCANNSLTWTSEDSSVAVVNMENATYVQLRTVGDVAHGITAAANRYIYLPTWASGVPGLYKVESVPSASVVRLDLAWVAGSGAPTVADTTTPVVAMSVTVPGGAIGPNGCIELDALITPSATGNNKTAKFKLDTYETSVVYTNAAARLQGKFFNRGAQALNGRTTALDGGAGVDMSGTIDTGVDKLLTLSFTFATAAEVVRINSLLVKLNPGL